MTSLPIQRPGKRNDPTKSRAAEEDISDGNVHMLRMTALD